VLNVWRERPDQHTRYDFFGESHHDFDRYVDEMATLRQGTRVPCSCHMCGNPRRYFGAPYKGEEWTIEEWGEND
jgi:hypothetical protein